MKNIINEYRAFNKDEKDLAHCILVGLVLAMGLIWLTSTNTYPRLDHKTKDGQTYVKPNYELRKSYTKYAQGVYNRKYEK